MREKQFDVERQDQNPFPGYSMKPNGHSSSTPEPVSYIDGYPRVAAFMSLGNDLAVFRKFDRMSLRSLLFQQSQLLDLENEIDQLDAQDKELIDFVFICKDTPSDENLRSNVTEKSYNREWER